MAKRKKRKVAGTQPMTHKEAHDAVNRQTAALTRIFDTYVVIGMRRRPDDEPRPNGLDEALMYFKNGAMTVVGGMALDTYVALHLKTLEHMGIRLTDTQREELLAKLEANIKKDILKKLVQVSEEEKT